VNAGLEPSPWHDIFTTTATISAALLGLYFVAISLRLQEFEDRPLLLSRARGGLRGLMIGLMLSVLVLIPAQPDRVLGVELVAAEITYLLIIAPAFAFTYRAPRIDDAASRAIGALSVLVIAGVVTGGVSLMIDRGPGLYLVIPAPLAIILISTYFAWSVMFGIAGRRGENR
jgi:hypothetical protein